MRSLDLSGIRFVLPLLLSAAIGAGGAAQTPASPTQPTPGRAIPATISLSKLSPFALDAHRHSFRVIPAAEMSPQDRELLASSQASLRRAAAHQGIAFDQGAWQHVQLACPSFPNHLLVRFERNSARGDTSIFSAAIPQGNSIPLLLPILRRSYSMFSAAPRNARTIAIFNRLLHEEKTVAKPDWVSLAACYAAFSDQVPEIGVAGPIWQTAPEPILRLGQNGRSSIGIVTIEPDARRWELKFAPNGRLLAATCSTEESPRFHPIPAGQIPVGRAVPQPRTGTPNHQ